MSPDFKFIFHIAIGLIAAGTVFLLGLGIGVEASPRPTKSDWSQVIVVSNGVQIAEPWNMTPRELARSQIIDRSPRLIGFGCEGMGGLAMVAEEESDFPICRDIHSIE